MQNYLSKISVVVPVYNVKQYLNRCIESIINQTYQNLEVILVDDGSPDNCGVMCEQWSSKDARIKVMHKQNEGLGYARNSGMQIATGEYITFVDSDDYLDTDAYRKAVNILDNGNIDICYFGCIDVWNQKQIRGKPPAKLIYEGKDIIEQFIMSSYGKEDSSPFTGGSACCAIYKYSLLADNHIQFLSERNCLSEDIIFNIDVCAISRKINILPECLYYYCHNATSLTTSYRNDRVQASVKLYYMLMERMKKLSVLKEKHERIMQMFLHNIISSLKQEILNHKLLSHTVVLHNVMEICKNDTVCEVLSQYDLASLPFKQKILFWSIKKKKVFLVILMVRMKLLLSR